MKREEVANQLKSILVEISTNPITHLESDKNLYDLGVIDSLNMIHLIAKLESTFSILIDYSDTENSDFLYFDGLVNIVLSKLTHD